MTQTIEESFEKIAKLDHVKNKYKDLFAALLKLKRESAINDVVIVKVALPYRWFDRYPELSKDLSDVGLRDKIFGLEIE